MEFNIHNAPLQEAAFIVAVVGVTLSIGALVLRFVATRHASRKPGWEDWFAVLAVFFHIAYVVPFLYILRTFNGKDARHLTADEFTHMTKAGYFMAAQFCLQQLFAKLSILVLFYRFFFVDTTFVRAIYAVGTVQIIWSVVTYMLHWFECTPPAKLWTPKMKGSCLNAPAFLAAGESINSIVDFVVVGLAIYMVQHLQLKTAVKAKLAILFGLGSLAGVLGFVKIAQGYMPMKSEKVALMDPIWATVQQACSVICCCAPIYKALFPKSGLIHKIRVSFFSRSHVSRSRTADSNAHVAEKFDSDGLKEPENAPICKAKKYSNDSIIRNEYDEREDSFANVHFAAVPGRG
ncbi:hypothetical protein N0V90_010004 [Kalmusia sp. IMI 367209]|nr:hypothetical protein N0V90_010004 [Kalmusia sp. IMI 367209]